MLNKNKFLGVEITNETSNKILEYVFSEIKNNKKFYIVTPNPEILVYSSKHPKYRNILNEAKIALPDGVGLFLASVIMGKPFRQRIPGVNFMEELCKRSVRNGVSIGFLGGKAGVAEKTAECLLKKYPGLNIVYISEEWGERGFERARVLSSRYQVVSSKREIKNKIHATKYTLHNTNIDLLFVAFGHPKQEEWIYENLEKIPVKVAMGVGGAFDYISGDVKRAPFMIRAIGFEWLFRLIKQPWRWRRQLALFEFVKLVFRDGNKN